jgi:hypothetical protein
MVVSILELFSYFEEHPWYLIGYTVGLPVVAIALRLVHGGLRAQLSPWKYLYSAVIYLSCIPGIFVFFSALYLAVFRRENLLGLDMVVYALPVLSMIFTLLVVKRTIDFDDIPGFQRISGLFALTVATFALLFVLDRLRILIFFRASIVWFLVLGIAIFFGLKIGARLLFGKRR